MNDIGDLLALDPSVRSPGAALFRNGKLVAATRVRVGDLVYQSEAERWLLVADAICTWLRGFDNVDVSTFIFERPQIYTDGKGKGDPNQLIALAGIGAALAAALSIARSLQGRRPLSVLSPKPAEWCGQLPKATTGSAKVSPRATRILSRLSSAEQLVVPDQHDALDAVGLGLHALGRLGVRRVFTSGE